ncbi:MAG: pyridoxamine 5'-phosphate oxidase family protein, partial [Pseudomonadota bacterium]
MNDLPPDRPSPWHPGETALQERAGVAERMALWGQKVIRDYMPDQHRDFYRQLPFILIGTVDKAGRPWASLLEGEPGFVHSPDPRVLMLDHLPSTQDPASAGLGVGAAVGLLGIELQTRRRNRVNGRVAARTGTGFSVEVEHAFGNCPQYIQLRVPEGVAVEPPTPAPAAQHHDGLDPAARALIAAADTFFAASYIDHQDGGMGRSVDVSHRGGQAGFVRVAGDCLTIPDYAGNLHFNTLGNLQLNPRAGLLFIDFASGELLHLSGRTELVFEGPELRAFEGAERLWKLQVETLVRRPAALARRWHFEAYSPASLATGTWAQADQRLRSPWRPLRVVRVEAESANIRSLYLEPEDLAAPGTFLAGQHLPLRLEIEGQAAALIRTYSLSSAPSDELLR